ncbi:MAG: hypothetical protein LLF76_05075 [Planctomycetaceae bacterium]|nr:hypothetical protein [Planctomycetaceae bacterium]
MKDIKQTLRNPNFYYIAVPAVSLFFALLSGFVSYPRAVQAWSDSKDEYEKSQKSIGQLLELQPERLALSAGSGQGDKFDFTVIVDNFAKAFSLAPSNYTTSVKGEVKKQGKTARTATLSIKSIDIVKLTEFLSSMLAQWPDLECDILSLNKTKAGKDDWKADLTLTYYY